MSIEEWTREIIEGSAGLHTLENRECMSFNVPRDVGVARFVIRCLANPACYGSEEVLAQIRQRRDALRASARHAEVAAIFGDDIAPEIHDGEEVTT